MFTRGYDRFGEMFYTYASRLGYCGGRIKFQPLEYKRQTFDRNCDPPWVFQIFERYLQLIVAAEIDVER